jgi:hypothetical protein
MYILSSQSALRCNYYTPPTEIDTRYTGEKLRIAKFFVHGKRGRIFFVQKLPEQLMFEVPAQYLDRNIYRFNCQTTSERNISLCIGFM